MIQALRHRGPVGLSREIGAPFFWNANTPAVAELESAENAISITSDAMGVLHQFDSRIGDVMYVIAEETARERSPGSVVEIKTEDVRHAGELVISGLQKMVEVGKLSPRLLANLDEILDHIQDHVR